MLLSINDLNSQNFSLKRLTEIKAEFANNESIQIKIADDHIFIT